MKIQKNDVELPILLVEGKDDQHVVYAVCNRYRVPLTFEVTECNGINNLLKQIPVRLKTEKEKLGIVVDADVDLPGQWQRLIDLLSPLGYRISDQPNAEGNILSSPVNRCIVGIWIMPDNRTSGMIEDFARILVPKKDLLWPYAEKALLEIENEGIANFKGAHRSKALIHTWLAWQETPGVPMGQAITKSYLNHNHELCIKFVAWLNALFHE